MDVSNSSDQDTGYRVVGGGGAAPSTWKLAAGQDVVEVRGKKFVKIMNLWHEVLAEGNLEPYTYITIKPRKAAHMVEFLRRDGSVPRCSVPGQAQTSTASPGTTSYLFALVQNGTGAAKTCVCRWKKV